MKERDRGRTGRFVLALVLGSMLGAFVGLGIRNVLVEDDSPDAAGSGPELLSISADTLHSGAAWAYVTAMQKREWDYVVDHTLWMRERLARAEASGEGRDVARKSLVANLAALDESRNQLKYNGIEDQYVFAPGAKCTVVNADAGRDDLEEPVVMRVWIKVEFPDREWAPFGPEGAVLRTLSVGVNLNQEGYVLKASITGNLDVRWDNIGYYPNE